MALWCKDNGNRTREHNMETHSGLREQGWAHATLPGPVLSNVKVQMGQGAEWEQQSQGGGPQERG